MPYITLTPAAGTVTVTAGGDEIARTTNAIELREGGMGPRLYVPRADVAMDRLTRSTTRSTCPHKGDASYFSTATTPDIAWCYESPKADVAAIAGHLAFYDGKVTVTRA